MKGYTTSAHLFITALPESLLTGNAPSTSFIYPLVIISPGFSGIPSTLKKGKYINTSAFAFPERKAYCVLLIYAFTSCWYFQKILPSPRLEEKLTIPRNGDENGYQP